MHKGSNLTAGVSFLMMTFDVPKWQVTRIATTSYPQKSSDCCACAEYTTTDKLAHVYERAPDKCKIKIPSRLTSGNFVMSYVIRYMNYSHSGIRRRFSACIISGPVGMRREVVLQRGRDAFETVARREIVVLYPSGQMCDNALFARDASLHSIAMQGGRQER